MNQRVPELRSPVLTLLGQPVEAEGRPQAALDLPEVCAPVTQVLCFLASIELLMSMLVLNLYLAR